MIDRLRFRFGRFTTRMLLSHIALAVLTQALTMYVLLDLATSPAGSTDAALTGSNRFSAEVFIRNWLSGRADGQPNGREWILTPGFAIIIAPDGRVIFSQGDTLCSAGVLIDTCEPDVIDAPIGERIIEVNGERQSELVGETAFGERIISHRAETPVAIAFGPNLSIIGAEAFLLALAVAISIAALPLATLATRLVVRPQSRRLAAIADMSRSFAAGDFDARVNDAGRDDIGDLARQFDDMAGTLQQNIDALRVMERRNAALAQQTQQSAIVAERVRLSRDLHDSIAQQLFTLSLTASTLPDLIRSDAAKAKHKVQTIAALSRDTLSELQTVLIDPRPSRVLQLGLAHAIETMVAEWQIAHHTTVECAVVLDGRTIAPEIEDIIYRVTQEALNNIAHHAQARKVQVSLVLGQRQLALAVSDDGIGFEPAAIANGKWGLKGMYERAEAIDAQLTIESERGRGTTLQLSVSLERIYNHDD